MIKMDLHMHTNHSNDGEFSVEELVTRVKKANVNIFAIADHNTTKGVQEYLEHYVDEDLTFIPAIEIDCMYEQTHLHVLGYGIDPYFDGFDELNEFYFHQDIKNSSLLIEKVEALDIIVNHEKLYALSSNNVITGEMIAEVVLQDSKNDEHPLLIPYRTGNTRSDNPYVNFYWDVCAINKPAYVETEYISCKAALDLIQKANGVCIVAHPGNNVFENEKLLKNIIDLGFSGIETYSSYHKLEQVNFYNHLANTNNWIQTIGSDFHGKTKPSITIGQCDSYEGDNVLFQELLNKIKEYKNSDI